MKILVVFALISTLAASAYGDWTCEELQKIGENGIRKMFIVEEGAVIPKTETEFEARCDEGKKLYKTLLDYKNCMKSAFNKEIFSTVTKSVATLIKNHCGTEKGKKTAMKLFQCATPEKIKDGQKCVVGALDTIQKLSDPNTKTDKLIAKLCCLTHVSADCAREKLGSITCPDPTVKPIDHFEEAMNILTKDTMELACDKYKNSAVCQTEIPDAVAEMRATFKNAGSTIGNRPLIAPMLAIAEKVALQRD